MKLFISHSSKNANYGNEFVNLLISVGVNSEQIIFTSNPAHGIPIGQNIFAWLKSKINERLFVIYLLSPEYYSSIACLNEMGGAWIVESEHAMIFTPNFEINTPEFQNGALDPREIGFFLNDEDKLIEFITRLKNRFNTSSNQVLINQKIRHYLDAINKISNSVKSPNIQESIIELESESSSVKHQNKEDLSIVQKRLTDSVSRFLNDVENNKLKDEDILVISYILDTGRYKLKMGWQEDAEINNIKTWEEVQELDNTLSLNYANVLRRFEMKKLTEISELTSHGNAKEVKICDELKEVLIYLDSSISVKINEVLGRHKIQDLSF